MILLLILAIVLHLGVCQLDSTLQAFQGMYDQTTAKFGEDYMKGIDFYQQVYNYEAIDGEEFDFIIVGSGPAGCVLTHRLSENIKIKVLLLEAGDVSTVVNDIPYLMPAWIFSGHNWGYKIEKDPHFGWGLINGTMQFPRGKGLGGTTLINYMLNTKGSKEDYNEMADMGNNEWAWDNIEKFFKALENAKIEFQDYEERGHWGPVTVEDATERTVGAQAYIEAVKLTGRNYTDYNGKSMLGTSFIQYTRKNGLRISAEKAYLRPIKNRPNLKILTRSLVEKIIINKKKVATGVRFSRNGNVYTVKARKEVILSAGTFASPQLLMLSGIGPAKELKKHNILCIKNSPVGHTMYDHLTFFGDIYEADEPITFTQPSIDMDKLVTDRTGLLAFGFVEAKTFLQTKNSDKVKLKSRPNMEHILFAGDFSIDGGTILGPAWGVSSEFYNSFYKQREGKTIFSIMHCHFHPKSVGRLTLRSANINDHPVIHYPFLSEREDVETFLESIKQSLEICKQEPLAKYGVRPIKDVIPQCVSYEFHSDKYWECAMRTLSISLQHQTATCRMGPRKDPLAVVDQQGRVYGIKKLRVADTSILPISVSAHTTIPSYIIGEKISFDIKQEYFIKKY